MPSYLGVVEDLVEGPSSTSIPSSKKAMWSATSRAKPISWVTQSRVMPVAVNSHMAAVLGTGDRTELVELGILPAEPTAMPVGLTAMMDSGHLGTGLTVGLTGWNAFIVICRLDLEMAHTASTAKRAVT